MDVISICAIRASGFEWQPRVGTHALTVVCKATCLLQPDQSTLAAEQEPLNDEDEHWNDDPARSVRAPSDRAPYKPRVDVVLVGSGFAPKQQPVRSFLVRLAVGEIDKPIEIWCDRALRAHDGQLLEGQRITKMPLRWERAAGGPDTHNPSGMRFDAPPDRYGTVAVPNLQPSGIHVAGREDTFPPIGYGPIAPTWHGRAQKLHRHASSFFERDWSSRPLPDDFDYSYFNMAPPDQQLSELVPGEPLLLENLHPEHARLVTKLPAIWPRAVALRATGEREELALAADTLWLDTDRGICTIVWRGRMGLRHPKEAGRVTITMDGAESAPPREKAALQTLAPGLIPVDDPEAIGSMTLMPIEAPAPKSQIMPFAGGDSGARSPGRSGDMALPFGRGEGALAAAPRALEAGLTAETIYTVPQITEAPLSPVAMAMTSQVSPPPLVRGPEPVAPPLLGAASPMGVSWSGESPAMMQGSLSIGQRVAGGVGADGSGRAPDKVPVQPGSPLMIPVADRAAPLKDAAVGGAAAASNAAAQAAPRPSPSRVFGGRTSVELVWLNPGSMGRIRKQEVWKEILDGIRPRPEDEDLDDDLPPARRMPARDRRELMTLLSHGEPLDTAAVEEALYRAMEDEDGYSPPLVLVAGELEMRFDELETLKALLAGLSPHVAADKRLEESVAKVQDAMKMPWTQGSTSVIEEMTEGLRRQFAEARKGTAPEVLEAHVERALLEGRHYRKRTALGQPRLVGTLSAPGTRFAVPVYLPDSLGKELPALRRMGVRLIAEVRPRAEQSEASPAALRAVALGRVVGGER